MTKRSVVKKSPVSAVVEMDMAGLVEKMMQHLMSLDKKMDILINRPQSAPIQSSQFQKPFSHGARPENRGGHMRQDSSFRERILHKAVCADCGNSCEVPFKPSGNRPVYCKECFGKRKDDKPFRSDREEGSVGARHRDKAPFYNKFVESARKPAGRKKTSGRKRSKKM